MSATQTFSPFQGQQHNQQLGSTDEPSSHHMALLIQLIVTLSNQSLANKRYLPKDEFMYSFASDARWSYDRNVFLVNG